MLLYRIRQTGEYDCQRQRPGSTQSGWGFDRKREENASRLVLTVLASVVPGFRVD